MPVERAASGEPGEAYQLAEAVFNRPDGTDMTAAGQMTLTIAGGSERQRSFTMYRRDTEPKGEIQSLIRFHTPSNIRDTGLLVDTALDGNWIYLPALDRVRRISRENRGGKFVQSQIYYEDMENRNPDEDQHTLLADGTYEGVTTSVLESVPLDSSSSTYSKRVSWIHPELLLPLRVDFFEGDADPRKRLEVLRLDEIDGYWTVTQSRVTDLERGDSTTMTLSDVAYDRGLPEGMFTTGALSSPAKDQSSRSP